MDPENPNWFLATTLKERVALLRENLHDCGTLDATVAERKLKQWRTSALLNAEAVFAERLAADEISDTEFRQVLGTSADSILNRFPNPPRWFADFIAAFSAPTLQQLPPLPESLRDCQLTSLLCVVRPIIAQVLAHLHAEIEVLNRTKSDLPFDPRTIDNILYESLPLGLITILSRTAALELNVARLEGQLKGSTPEQRYQSFLERMSSRSEAFRMLGEYPVLTRLLIEEANRWLDRSLEFLRRLCEDWSTIKSSIAAAGNPGVLVKVDAGAGDHHNNGRSVLIANFDSGFRAVYKPRSLAVDVHFQDLLLWLNQRGVQPEFRTMKVLKHGSYAWTEFISAKSCESHEEVWRFYQRLGGYLAILYVLGATDFHYENLIAAGEHPVLIDLEALFHPPLESVQSGHADELAWNAVYHSVLGIGLLPQRIRSKDGS